MSSRTAKHADEESYYTTTEAARICRTAVRTVARWVDRGKIRGYRLPSTGDHPSDRRISHSGLREFLVANGMPTDRLEEASLTTVLLVGISGEAEAAITDALGSTYKVEPSANVFDAGRLAATLDPDFIVIDTAIGRMDARVVMLGARATGRASMRIVVVCGQDECDGMAAFGRIVLPRPLDATAIARAIREKTEN